MVPFSRRLFDVLLKNVYFPSVVPIVQKRTVRIEKNSYGIEPILSIPHLLELLILHVASYIVVEQPRRQRQQRKDDVSGIINYTVKSV